MSLVAPMRTRVQNGMQEAEDHVTVVTLIPSSVQGCMEASTCGKGGQDGYQLR